MTGQVGWNVTPPRPDVPPRPDTSCASAFLELLDPTASNFRFRTFTDAADALESRCHKFRGTLDEVASALEAENNARRGVFVVVNSGGDTDASITDIRAVFADADGAPLDPIMCCGLHPHVVIATSPGKWHAYWLVTGLAVDQFKGVQRQIACRFGTDRSVVNPSRVMRLPGFDHHKGQPFRVRTIHESGKPAYRAAEVLAAFPPLDEFPSWTVQDQPVKARSMELRPARIGSVSSYADGALRRAAENIATASEGSRNTTLNREAFSLAGIADLSDETIIGALVPAAHAAGLASDEIDSTIASGIASGRNHPRETPPRKERTQREGGGDVTGCIGDDFDGQPSNAPVFATIDLSDLGSASAEPDRYAIDPLIPVGVVTMLSGHGGSGKTMLSLIIGAHFALGATWGPYAFSKGRVLFVSLEDPGNRIRATLARICHHYRLNPNAVAENFTVIDCAAAETALAAESNDFRGNRLTETRAYFELLSLATGFDLIIIDNASDAFEGNENERRQVRKFVRGMLGRIARKHDCAVLLLAHIDKSAAKFGSKKNSYSGSTAWHNSARSRLAIIEAGAGGLELIQEKNNLGRKAEPLQLAWNEDGMLMPSTARLCADTDNADTFTAADDEEDVFKSLKIAIASGATITSKREGPITTLSALKKYDALPAHLRTHRGKERFWAALTRLERVGRISVEDYINHDRKPRSKWAIALESAI